MAGSSLKLNALTDMKTFTDSNGKTFSLPSVPKWKLRELKEKSMQKKIKAILAKKSSLSF